MDQFIRKLLLRRLTGERALVLTRNIPSPEALRAKLAAIRSIGLYLHIPFCERICPYCPYNKEVFRSDLAQRYVGAVKAEADFYAGMLGGKPVTSLYVGGGTPTTMLDGGLTDLMEHLRRTFNLQCDIHLESHPNHLTPANLKRIKTLGVQHLSLGVEALFDRHLQFLGRPYTAENVKHTVQRALAAGFKCVNVDVMFDLPGQTFREIEETGRELVRLGVDQVAAYPLFRFPHTPLGKGVAPQNHTLTRILRRRRMLRILENIFREAGYQRTSVWAFTRRGVPRYCSVTVPIYLGLGASGGSYLPDVFYVNTFGVSDYVDAMEKHGRAIALSLDLSERMQKAGWLYWRIYETRFAEADYRERFGEDLQNTYGRYLWLLRCLGLLSQEAGQITLSDRGSYWLHAIEDFLSIDSVGKLWGASRREPWPEKVVL